MRCRIWPASRYPNRRRRHKLRRSMATASGISSTVAARRRSSRSRLRIFDRRSASQQFVPALLAGRLEIQPEAVFYFCNSGM